MIIRVSNVAIGLHCCLCAFLFFGLAVRVEIGSESMMSRNTNQVVGGNQNNTYKYSNALVLRDDIVGSMTRVTDMCFRCSNKPLATKPQTTRICICDDMPTLAISDIATVACVLPTISAQLVKDAYFAFRFIEVSEFRHLALLSLCTPVRALFPLSGGDSSVGTAFPVRLPDPGAVPRDDTNDSAPSQSSTDAPATVVSELFAGGVTPPLTEEQSSRRRQWMRRKVRRLTCFPDPHRPRTMNSHLCNPLTT
jgi:hypothetical protein